MIRNDTPILILAMFVGQCLLAQNIQFRSKIDIPGQSVDGVWGYAAGGREYALVGAKKGMIVIDVTNPDTPFQILMVPENPGFGREIRTYGHFAYVSKNVQNYDSLTGIHIIDLSKLPSPDLDSYLFTGEGATAGLLRKSHTLHIDETKGFMYLYSTNIGKLQVYDLKDDPYHPKHVGTYDQLGGFHDGYVDNDTLYGAQLSSISIIDMNNKSAPVILSTESASGVAHNTWPSPDKKTMLVTNEYSGAPLNSYDISNPGDIVLLDKVLPEPGIKSVPHNTFVRGNFAITSWYTAGVVIVNTTRPKNLVVTGRFDTYPNNDHYGFDGCWGVYPYLPSGNIIAGNSPDYFEGEVFILTPEYKEAAYLEGIVRNSDTGNPVPGATVELLGIAIEPKLTSNVGEYAMGYSEPGSYSLRVSKIGYFTKTIQVNMESGIVNNYEVELVPTPIVAFSGSTTDAATGNPVAGIKVFLVSEFQTISQNTDLSGNFSFPQIYTGKYDIFIGKWGYRFQYYDGFNIDSTQAFNILVEPGYEDPFLEAFNYPWTTIAAYPLSDWVKGEPIMQVFLGMQNAPETDVDDDIGDWCFITGNTSVVSQNNVRDSSLLASPSMNLSPYLNPRISFKYAAKGIHYSGINNKDTLHVYIQSGIVRKRVAALPAESIEWKLFSFDVTDFMPLGNSMKLIVVAKAGPGANHNDSFRAAIDDFKVEDQLVPSIEPASKTLLTIQPNPFNNSTTIRYDNNEPGSRLLVYDLLGRLVEAQALAEPSGKLEIGKELKIGSYFLQLEEKSGVLRALKLIKVN